MNQRFTARSFLLLALLIGFILPVAGADESKWHVLFDGSSLDGWRSNDETPGVFTIVDGGILQVKGGRAHLFWMGTDAIPAKFTNFELRADVRTTSGSNSGIFFHSRFQERGWPEWGLEAQVNSTHKDSRKTGSIYALQDILNDAPSVDGQWFRYLIKVEGKVVTVSINGEVVNQYTEPEGITISENGKHAYLQEGTFAIQGHDPKSTVFYKDIAVRVLD